MDTQDTVQPDIYDADGNIIDLDAAIASGRVVRRKNGVLQDTATGRFVRGGMPITAIRSPSDAVALNEIKKQRKREVIAAAALEAVQSGQLRTQYGDAAWIAEIAQTQQTIATTPDAGRAATAAADWLIQHTGLAEDRAQQRAAVTVDMGSDDDLLLVVMRRRMQADDVVDGDIVDGDEG